MGCWTPPLLRAASGVLKKMQSPYVAGTSLLHVLNPLTKLAAAALVIAVAYVLPWWFAPLACFAVLLVLALLGGVAGPLVRTVVRLLLPITLSLFLIQGILFPPAGATPLPLGPITLTREGLLFAFVVSTRLLALSTSILLVLKTTHPADLVFALTQRGLPRTVGYILLVTLQIVPDMSARATGILEVQRSRGLETKGGLRRVAALVPLLGPLVVGALSDVEERAIAIESRAFTAPGPKTTLRELTDSRVQQIMRVGLLILTIAVVVARFTVLRGRV